MFARTRSRTRSLVCSRWQSICGRSMRAGQKRKRHRRIVAALDVRRRPRATWRSKSMLGAIEPRRRPGFRRPHSKSERLQRLGEIARRRLAGATGRMLLRPDVNQTVQKRAGRDDQRDAR